jgi:hypothetical protein
VDARLARRLIALYPRVWKGRYADEFAGVLEAHPLTVGTVVDVCGWAIRERVLAIRSLSINARQRAVILMAYAALTALAAGVNFYWTVDGTPMADAMRAHRELALSFQVIARAAFAAGLIAIAVAAPLVVTIVRSALASGRWDTVAWLAVPVAAAITTVGWIATAMLLTGTRWAPTPWDVTGDWTAPAAWPALTTRWALAAVTFVLLLVGLAASGASVAQALRRTDLSAQPRAWLVGAAVAFTAATVAMVVGVAAWGWFSEQYAGVQFHAINGGLFNSSNFASWLLSTITFVAAVATSIQGTRSALLSE